jgi:predicted transcriptional regulator
MGLTIEEFAERVGHAHNSISRILLADQSKPEEERRIKGAVKHGEGRRGVWDIPESAVATFERDGRGRPKRQP